MSQGHKNEQNLNTIVVDWLFWNMEIIFWPTKVFRTIVVYQMKTFLPYTQRNCFGIVNICFYKQILVRKKCNKDSLLCKMFLDSHKS